MIVTYVVYLANSWEEVADDDYLRALLVIFLTTTLTVLAWNKAQLLFGIE